MKLLYKSVIQLNLEIKNICKKTVTHVTKVVTNLSNKYSQKLLHSAKKSTTHAIKTASKTTIW